MVQSFKNLGANVSFIFYSSDELDVQFSQLPSVSHEMMVYINVHGPLTYWPDLDKCYCSLVIVEEKSKFTPTPSSPIRFRMNKSSWLAVDIVTYSALVLEIVEVL